MCWVLGFPIVGVVGVGCRSGVGRFWVGVRGTSRPKNAPVI